MRNRRCRSGEAEKLQESTSSRSEAHGNDFFRSTVAEKKNERASAEPQLKMKYVKLAKDADFPRSNPKALELLRLREVKISEDRSYTLSDDGKPITEYMRSSDKPNPQRPSERAQPEEMQNLEQERSFAFYLRANPLFFS